MKAIVFTATLFILIASCRSNKRIDRDKLVAQICQALKDDDSIDESEEKRQAA